MKNTADLTGGKPIALWSQSISGVTAINPLVTFYAIHGRNSEVLFFYFVPDIIREKYTYILFCINTENTLTQYKQTCLQGRDLCKSPPVSYRLIHSRLTHYTNLLGTANLCVGERWYDLLVGRNSFIYPRAGPALEKSGLTWRQGGDTRNLVVPKTRGLERVPAMLHAGH
jgi:hypothetical protein